MAQEAPGGPESLIEVVLAADKERTALLTEAETADGFRRAEIETRLNDIGAYSAPARAATILHGLGFDSEAQNRPCSSFSGGWRMRVALAAILFSEPDLLLLDEPTNYLDLEGTLWLYDYLGRYPHTVLVISHDRELLDTSVSHILHLDQAKLSIYRGGYTSFAKQFAEKRELTAKAKVKQDAERKHLQAFVDRFKAKASKARQAQSRVKRLAKLDPISTIVEDDVLPFDLPSPERMLAPPLIAVEGVAVGYGDRTILDRLNLTIQPDDRIALLGANGNGKSTFCKLIGGRLAPLKGEMRRTGQDGRGLFRPASGRRTEPERHRLRPRGGEDARRAGREGRGRGPRVSASPERNRTLRYRACRAARRLACSWAWRPSTDRTSSSSTSPPTTSTSTAAPP